MALSGALPLSTGALLRSVPVKQGFLVLPIAALALSSCATDPYGASNAGRRAEIGAAIGAVAGALGGRAVGSDAFTGAAVGALAGGAIGALMPVGVVNGRQYYRDSRGYCYYIDANGHPQYDPAIRC
jgi:hypothetical protein